MSLKNYMRGLGIGIAVTTILIHVSRFGNAAGVMSDEDIMKRAKELGMIENTVLGTTGILTAEEVSGDKQSDNTSEGEPSIGESTGSLPALTPDIDSYEAEGNGMAASDSIAAPLPPSTDATPIVTPKPSEPASDTSEKFISIEVKNGDGSMNVAKRLEEAGLVDSAAAFDTYLCDNHFDNVLFIGIHKIPEGSSEAEIARILMTTPAP